MKCWPLASNGIAQSCKLDMKAKSLRKSSAALAVRAFECQKDWAKWLKENHESSPGVWLQLAKKNTDIASVSYEEAVETALCFGWIDGQKKSHSERYWLQKFTPRSDKSVWSKINKQKAMALIKAGKMQTAGLHQVERAKRDGRWDAAYDSSSTSVAPEDFQSALDGNARAKAFFATLDSRNRYAMLFRIQTARTAATRAKRISKFVDMLKRHEKIYP
jgi:uncharacterized protein YdeI (YjbR/CyaY-like superfamily)